MKSSKSSSSVWKIIDVKQTQKLSERSAKEWLEG